MTLHPDTLPFLRELLVNKNRQLFRWIKLRTTFESLTIALATLLMTSCHSSWEMMEYLIDYHQNEEEIGFEQLPEKAQQFHKVCHTPGDIKEVNVGKLSHYGDKVYEIIFSDGGEMLFDKKGRCLSMDNWRDGLPECWTNQIPLYNAMHMAITIEMKELNNDAKPWNVRCLEIHPNGYLIKAGIGIDIYQFYFNKNGKLKDVAIEI